jgi:hypothetical protein
LSPLQLDLFSQQSLHTVVRDIKAAMNQAVKESGQSRDQVLDRMNALAKRQGIALSGKDGISKDLFEKWLNVEDDSRVPGLKALALFCAALGTATPSAVLVSLLGGMVIEGEDVRLLRWARAYHKAKNLRREMRKLEDEL